MAENTAPAPVHVTVAAGRAVYVGGASEPFREGHALPLHPAVANDLLAAGHVVLPKAEAPSSAEDA